MGLKNLIKIDVRWVNKILIRKSDEFINVGLKFDENRCQMGPSHLKLESTIDDVLPMCPLDFRWRPDLGNI